MSESTQEQDIQVFKFEIGGNLLFAIFWIVVMVLGWATAKDYADDRYKRWKYEQDRIQSVHMCFIDKDANGVTSIHCEDQLMPKSMQ